ncbi:unnamed protein product [Bemisia tabaci]|uniref:M-phase phosphoprotein 6 n=1 Tax=Bemisia tabaci TaxID=7038 RepID=A0A9P0F4V7_BEMTA|nr:PREDICTED: M-phase phosphoprotein 6 [Bemisia tabaci]CAH0388169.1 unnamed protein product [Bemisia tabaci]
MSAKHLKRKKLSKHILEMKFMQRTKEKVRLLDEEEEGRATFSSELTEQMADQKSNYFIQPSFAVCDGLMPSRLSFLGMNPLIEKFMKGEAGSDVQTKEEADVSLEEMAETYASNSTLVETMANKFHKKKRDKSNDKEPDRKKMRLSDT